MKPSARRIRASYVPVLPHPSSPLGRNPSTPGGTGLRHPEFVLDLTWIKKMEKKGADVRTGLSRQDVLGYGAPYLFEYGAPRIGMKRKEEGFTTKDHEGP